MFFFNTDNCVTLYQKFVTHFVPFVDKYIDKYFRLFMESPHGVMVVVVQKNQEFTLGSICIQLGFNK